MAYINGKEILFSPHINITGGDTTELEEQIADLTAENTELKTQNAELEETVSNLVATNNELMQDVANADAYGEQLEAELEDALAYIEELEIRIEELEGGGDEPTDQTALAGAYTPDGTFSNRVYTWDELYSAEIEEDGFFEEENGSLSLFAPYYVVVKDGISSIDATCGDIVISNSVAEITYLGDYYEAAYENIEYASSVYMEKIYLRTTTPPAITGELNTPHLIKIVVPIGCGDAYKSATGWCDYAEYIEEGEMPI